MDNLRDGFIYRVGQGNISLWYEKWLHKGKPGGRVPFVDIHDTALQVKDIRIGDSWDFNLLYTSLPAEITEEIIGIFTNDNTQDLLIWETASDGQYSSKSAYAWLTQPSMVNNSDHPCSMSWSWIWKLNLPENIQHFVWLVMHGSLPTNHTRLLHHVSLDGSCQRCGSNQETILHTLRDCPRSQQVWQLLGFDFNHNSAYCCWFRENATKA